MLDQTPKNNILRELSAKLDAFPSLTAAFREVEPLILKAFDASRISLFQRRRQHQDLVARFKTGQETREIKVPISPLSVAGYVAMSQQAILIEDPYNDEKLKQKTFGLHILLHSIATHLLQSGMKLEYISRFLGHKSLETTQKYTHLAKEENV